MLGKDSAEGIASELVGAGLVDGRDIVVIAANLRKLIDSNGEMKTVTFPLVSIINGDVIYDNIISFILNICLSRVRVTIAMMFLMIKR